MVTPKWPLELWATEGDWLRDGVVGRFEHGELAVVLSVAWVDGRCNVLVFGRVTGWTSEERGLEKV